MSVSGTLECVRKARVGTLGGRIRFILVSPCRVRFAGRAYGDMPARPQPVPLQRDRDQRSFGFLHEGHSATTIAVDPDEVTQLTCRVATRSARGKTIWRPMAGFR